MSDPRSPHTPRALGAHRNVPLGVYGLALWLVCAGILACGAAPGDESAAFAAAASETSEPPATDPTDDADAEEAARAAAFEARFPLGVSPSARLDTADTLIADLAAPRHASDGGGSARLVDPESGRNIPVGSTQRFEILYEAGPLGIDVGGQILLQASPFWGWDSPQSVEPDAPGYTEFRTDAEGVTLEPGPYHPDLLSIVVGGRRLEAGETVHITYGAGPAGVRVDRYAEADEHIYLSVDGDGDGVRALLSELPRIETISRTPRRIEVHLPTVAAPGAPVECVVAILDPVGNLVGDAVGEVRLEFESDDEGAADAGSIPPVALRPEDGGRRTVRLSPPPVGILRLRAEGTGALEGLEGASNPLLVRAGVTPVYWGDLHGHSQLSDGTGTPDQYYTYARSVAGLDFAALTDHDHWGMRFLDATPSMWTHIEETVARHHDPGHFVTLLGYEWTSWLQGHRHVLYFDEDGTVHSSLAPETDSPDELWAALEGQPALTFAHHSAGGPVATNWRYRPDPVLEPVTEIVSVHGSSEAPDSPARIYSPVPGNFVRDTLSAGYVFGFIGSGDSHDGHPGLAHRGTAPDLGGLAAIRASALTRPALLEALRARRTYATNGARIYLDVRIDGAPMGSFIAPPEAGDTEQTLEIEVVGTAPIARVDLIRSGRTATIEFDGERAWRHSRTIPPLQAGEYHYVRVVQVDEGAAWSSPIYARPVSRP